VCPGRRLPHLIRRTSLVETSTQDVSQRPAAVQHFRLTLSLLKLCRQAFPLRQRTQAAVDLLVVQNRIWRQGNGPTRNQDWLQVKPLMGSEALTLGLSRAIGFHAASCGPV